MKARVKNTRGFTLIELLVVISIMATLAAIAIPTLIRAGAFQKEYIEQSSRTLYNMLKAAEFYASTYNVETCLAYAAYVGEADKNESDSVTDLDVIVARSIGVFRRATDEELAAWQTYYAGTPDEVLGRETGIEPDTPAFVPVGEINLTEFQEGACVLGDWDETVPQYAPFWEEVSGYPAKGLKAVRIRTEDGMLVTPHVEYPNIYSVPDCWAAHVFSPAGYVESDVSHERLVMNVGATPWSDPDDRFIEPYPDPPAPLVPLDPITVQISKSSARIKIVE